VKDPASVGGQLHTCKNRVNFGGHSRIIKIVSNNHLMFLGRDDFV